jgi:protocatechuate 3,4-dioxygenase alpha subunit
VRETPAQTIGPFFSVMLPFTSNLLCAAGPATITISGRVFDGAGEPVGDALLEIWQANEAGRYAHPDDDRELPLTPGFTGFGRALTAPDGSFSFTTVKPGPVPFDAERLQAPHINLVLFARGLLNRLTTRIYFEGEEANAADPVLRSITAPADRDSLVARHTGPRSYIFDLHLQGPKETAFFAI